MAATEPAAGDDALYVLTACLLTPARFPSVLGDDYPAACAALGLEPYEQGYGLIFGQDGLGARWTVVIDDVSLVAVAIASWDCGMAYDLSPDEESVVAGLPGWPLPVATQAPGVPDPHDPEPEEGDPAPLAPPAEDAWTPAHRRLGADEVALHWNAWREQIGPRPTAERSATADAAPGAAPSDGAAPDAYAGVRRAMDELHGYLEAPPPVGRVRSDASGEGVRTLRADGPGWSLVARTDDMAFFLLDELPREVLPVAPGPRLPALLEGLDAIAVRPS
ncbi:hypothetical protein HHL19_23620 [Streptomyces sp. R302]|uniref:hypothetical protein n=1 Tax=unclassified Streptomyces TaxID=2593676 RepID=UPI00145DAE0C|nr:hypothetical protein [Streptomyces sp. R301]NML81558.1 hypothetical protein [Streptomyces sp. R302]